MRNSSRLHLVALLMISCATVAWLSCRESDKSDTVVQDSTGQLVADTIPDYSFIEIAPDADYRVDFRHAMAKGDSRFVGILGFTVIVPGVPDYLEAYSGDYGVKVIEGTSDDFPDSASVAWQVFAESYAKGYNSLLLQKLGENKK